MNPKSKILLAALLIGGAGFAPTAIANSCRGPQPPICNRDCWSARAPQCAISEMSGLKRATIHHTASNSDYDTAGENESKGKVRNVQNYHMDVSGACDILYHFLVDKHGNIFVGRKHSGDLDYRPQGGHDSCNDRSFGYTALGYYHAPYNNAATTALMNSLKAVIAWRMPGGWVATDPASSLPSYCGKSLDAVISHREVKATACPGDILHNKVKNGSGFENDINALRTCN